MSKSISVAIIGAGPGGLAAAIAFSSLPFATLKVYERADAPREVGAGISIGKNAWNVLELLGVADDLEGAGKVGTTQRNAYTGEIIHLTPFSLESPTSRPSIRARRTALQAALLKHVPNGIIEYGSKVVSLHDMGEGKGVELGFHDGRVVAADLVIGADGIRSITRRVLFPEHKLHYTGNTAYRTLIPVSLTSHLEFPPETSWWHAKDGHFYFSHVDPTHARDMCELTLRSYHEQPLEGDVQTWGFEADNKTVLDRCKAHGNVKDYDSRVTSLVSLAPEGSWREFRMVAGPCLEDITGWDKIALIGDASHPLSGAFGSGAAFAMEDGWILARALEHSISSAEPVKDALRVFAKIRKPYYARMFAYLDDKDAATARLKAQGERYEDVLKARVAALGTGAGNSMDWIYKNDIGRVWEDYVSGQSF